MITFSRKIPDCLPWIDPSIPRIHPAQPGDSVFKEIKAIKEVLDDYRRAVDAAKIIDKLTGQPDCIDPEKARLEKRVLKLEAELAELKQATKLKKRTTKKKSRPAGER
jgi:hypothetical protein